jgi:hypothetical protein
LAAAAALQAAPFDTNAARLVSVALHHLRLQFFDVAARVTSDSASFIELLRHMYRRFEVDANAASGRSCVELVLHTQVPTSNATPVMELNRARFVIEDRRLLEGYVYESLLRAVLTQVRSHYLFHAGVVARDGRAVVLAADSFHGKTTLALELVRRGFAFLSDDVAALGRADGNIYPFARSLRVRPGTLELVGLPEVARLGRPWLDKLLFDIDVLGAGCVGAPARLGAVVVLHANDEATAAPADETWELCFVLDRVSGAAIAAIEQLDGVWSLNVAVDNGYQLLRVWAQRSNQVMAQIERELAQHGLTALDTIKRAYVEPSFAQSARLMPIGHSAAARELLRRFLGGQHSALLHDELSGSATRLLFELVTLLQGVACYRLRVGSLDEMATHICDLADAWRYEAVDEVA